MAFSRKGCVSPALCMKLTYGALLLFITLVCNVHSAPASPAPPAIPNLCPQENIATNQVRGWPNNIIPFTMSSNLTADVRREILKAMSLWEKRMCNGIVFVPHQQQAEVAEHFVSFVPGERCCSNRGKTSDDRQDVYVDDICIADRTLEDVIGTLIGTTQQTATTDLPRAEEEEETRKRSNITSSRSRELEEDSRTNVTNHTLNVHVNGSYGEQDGTYSSNECPNPTITHINGKANGRTKKGHIHSPNYPMDYESNTECIWKVKVPNNSVLRLHFGDFDTECSHDYLEIHHLNTAAGTIQSLDRLCGHLTGREPITSHLSIDTIILRFHTDVTYNRGGFNISYEFIENKFPCDVDNGGCSYKCKTDSSGIGNCICQAGYRANRSGACKDINECHTDSHGCEQNCRNNEGSYECFCNEGYRLHLGKKLCNRCEEVFNTTQGVIYSIGYPGPYQDQQNCRYTILIQPEHVLKMTLFVDINQSHHCKKEFLKMEHGFFMYNRRLCGYINNVSYYIRDANATSSTLRFRTRNLNSINVHPSGGFRVEFEQVLRSSVSDAELNRVQIGSSTIAYNQRPWLG